MRNSCLFILLAFLAGCETPAQFFWSPNGTQAVYIPTGGGVGAIIDDKGKILVSLKETAGGCAWSADSRNLYIAQMIDGVAADATSADQTWLNPMEGSLPELEKKDKDQLAQVSVLENGKPRPLFRLWRQTVLYMLLSPDAKWLAASTMDWSRGDKNGSYCLYIYNIQANKLHWASVGCGLGLCFTGEHRLGWIEPITVKNGIPSDLGELREMDLAEANDPPHREGRTGVYIGNGVWLQAVGDDILFATESWTLPGPAPDPEQNDLRPKKLFRYVRGEGVVKIVLDDIGPLFTISPDGKRALIEKKPPRFTDARSKLAVLDLASAKFHELCDYQVNLKTPSGQKCDGTPVFAAWRNNEQFCFVRQQEAEKPLRSANDRAYFDAVLYQITGENQLQVVRTLSGDWGEEMRPWVKVK